MLEPVLHIFSILNVFLFFLLKNTFWSHRCSSKDIWHKGFYTPHWFQQFKFSRRLQLGGRKFLLQGLVRSSNHINSILCTPLWCLKSLEPMQRRSTITYEGPMVKELPPPLISPPPTPCLQGRVSKSAVLDYISIPFSFLTIHYITFVLCLTKNL